MNFAPRRLFNWRIGGKFGKKKIPILLGVEISCSGPPTDTIVSYFRLFPYCCLQRAGWMTEELSFGTSGNKTFFLIFSKSSRPALSPTQTSYLIGAGISLHGLKAAWAWSVPITFVW